MNAEKNTFGQVLDLLASVKLALFLLIALAVAAVAGTVIPQNQQPQEYIQGFGPKLYTFLSYLDLFDMYHSWWFNLLLAALVLNLVVCTLKRLPMTARLARRVDPMKIKPEFLKKQAFNHQQVLTASLDRVLPLLKAGLGRGFRNNRETRTPWGTLLTVERGAFSRYGVYVVHASLLVIVAGGIVGAAGGFSAFLMLEEGRTAKQVVNRKAPGLIDLPFALRLDRFTVKFYDNGMPREYRSDVTVLEQGREVKKAAIVMNHPLVHRGVTFYQSSWDRARGGTYKIKAVRRSDGRSVEMVLTEGRSQGLPDQDGFISIVDFHENLMGAGPTARIMVRAKGASPYVDFAFARRPLGVPERGPWAFDLLRYDVRYRSGLQVNKDPGVPLIWIGCGLMIAGFIITFFFSHQKLFVGLIEEKNGLRILIAGSAHRNQGSFKIRFEQMVSRIHDAAAPGGA